MKFFNKMINFLILGLIVSFFIAGFFPMIFSRFSGVM